MPETIDDNNPAFAGLSSFGESLSTFANALWVYVDAASNVMLSLSEILGQMVGEFLNYYDEFFYTEVGEPTSLSLSKLRTGPIYRLLAHSHQAVLKVERRQAELHPFGYCRHYIPER